MESGIPEYNIIEPYLRADGTHAWAKTNKVALRDTEGNVVGVLGTYEDITERKRAEEALQASEARYRELFNHMSSGVAVCEARDDGADFVFTDFNQAGERIDKVRKEDLIGKSVVQVFPGVKEFGLFDVFLRVWKTGEPEHHPMSLYKDERCVGWRENHVYRLPSGEIVAVYDDVTERKQEEARIAYQANLLAQVSEAIVASDEQFRLTAWNTAAEALYGWKAEEVLGRYGLEITRTEWPGVDAEEMRRTIAETGRWRGEAIQARKDGTRIPVEMSTLVFRDDNGQITGYVSANRDITERKRAEEALRESEIRFRSLIENASDLVLILNPDHTIAYVSPSVERILGHTVAAVSGARLTDSIDPQDLPDFIAAIEHRARTPGPSPFLMQVRVRHADGSWRILEGMGNNLLDQPGVSGLVINARDITERKRAEEEIRSLARFPSEDPNPVLRLDQDGIVLYANEASGALLQKWDCGVGGTAPEFWRNAIAQILASQSSQMIEVEFDQRIYSFFLAPVVRGGYVNLYGWDVTERKRAEEERERLFQEVHSGRKQMQALSRRLVEAHETERRFIARELHDEIGQVLTGLKMMLETSSHLSADALRSRLSNAQSLVEQLVERVQGLSLDLRPTMLDDLGLLPALLWLAKRLTDQTGVRVILEHSGLDRRFAPEIETSAYRIVQEALTNVARHADVKEATARLWVAQDTFNIQVEDRGKGFNVKAIMAAPISIGLSGMRERALALAGDLIVESAPGSGTLIAAKLPLGGSLDRRMKER